VQLIGEWKIESENRCAKDHKNFKIRDVMQEIACEILYS